MGNNRRLKQSIGFWLLGLALAFMLLSPISKIEATSKVKDTVSQICGEHLELVWSKALLPPSSPKIKRGPIAMQVLPSGENYMVHTVISEGGESSDVPRDIDTFLLDTNGNTIWRRRYIDLPLVFSHGHAVSVGKQTYRYFDRYGGGEGGLRYHVWLDEKGFVQWIYAQRERFNIETFSQEWKEVEIVNDVVYNLVAKCQDGICQVDSLKISKKGVDSNGWQTILKWHYPEGNKDKVVYLPVSASTSHLLVYKKEPTGVKTKEFHLIQFYPDDNGHVKIKYDSKYFFPRESNVPFIKDKDRGFIFFIVEGNKGTFIKLDKAGKQIESKSYSLPQKFKTWIGAIKPFKDGWLISGWPETNDKKSSFIFTRLSSDGKPLYSIKWFNEFAGNDGENLFFSYDGTLYKCRERQAIKGK